MNELIELKKQLNLAVSQLYEELMHLTSGTIFFQIRNNAIGKFGIRHDMHDTILYAQDAYKISKGLHEAHVAQIRRVILQALQHKSGWTHGEMMFEFSIRQEKLRIHTMYESNYNMSKIIRNYDTVK